MARSKGPTMAWLAGIGAAAVLALGAIYWRDLLVNYHLTRLTREPGYLQEILPGPAGTVRRAAIEWFLRSRQGREALFREYAGVALESVFAAHAEAAGTLLEAVIWHEDERASYIEWFPPRQMASYGILLRMDDAGRWAAVRELLDRLQGEEYRLPELPDLRFEIVPGGQALKTCPRLAHPNILPPERELTCLVRREPQAVVAAIAQLLTRTNNVTHLEEYLRALGELGPAARPTLPVIRELLAQKTLGDFVRPAAEKAMARIEGAGSDGAR